MNVTLNPNFLVFLSKYSLALVERTARLSSHEDSLILIYKGYSPLNPSARVLTSRTSPILSISL